MQKDQKFELTRLNCKAYWLDDESDAPWAATISVVSLGGAWRVGIQPTEEFQVRLPEVEVVDGVVKASLEAADWCGAFTALREWCTLLGLTVGIGYFDLEPDDVVRMMAQVNLGVANHAWLRCSRQDELPQKFTPEELEPLRAHAREVEPDSRPDWVWVSLSGVDFSVTGAFETKLATLAGLLAGVRLARNP